MVDGARASDETSERDGSTVRRRRRRARDAAAGAQHAGVQRQGARDATRDGASATRRVRERRKKVAPAAVMRDDGDDDDDDDDDARGARRERVERGDDARERDARLTNEVDRTGRAQGVVNGFPLKIVPKETREVEVDFNAEFLTHMLPKMEWGAFVNAAKEIGVEGLPSEIPDDAASDEEFLRTFHHALLEVHVEEGTLVCPESGRKFPINKGIPNMLLNEDEV